MPRSFVGQGSLKRRLTINLRLDQLPAQGWYLPASRSSVGSVQSAVCIPKQALQVCLCLSYANDHIVITIYLSRSPYMGSYANDHDLITIIVAVLTRTFFFFVNMAQIESFEKRELQLRKLLSDWPHSLIIDRGAAYCKQGHP